MSFAEELVPRGSMWSFQKFQSPVRGKNQWWSFQEGGNSRGPMAQDWQDGIKGSEQWHWAGKNDVSSWFQDLSCMAFGWPLHPFGLSPRSCKLPFWGMHHRCRSDFFFWDLNVNTMHCYKKRMFTLKVHNLKKTADPRYLNILSSIVVLMQRPLWFRKRGGMP